MCIKGELLGEVPGSSMWASSLWLIVLTIIHLLGYSAKFSDPASGLFINDQIWKNTSNFGGLGVGTNQPLFLFLDFP
jgi:hypothetical protein